MKRQADRQLTQKKTKKKKKGALEKTWEHARNFLKGSLPVVGLALFNGTLPALQVLQLAVASGVPTMVMGCESSRKSAELEEATEAIQLSLESNERLAEQLRSWMTHLSVPSVNVISDTCSRCGENPTSMVLLPCNDMGLCADCASQMNGQPCPFCNKPVTSTLSAFLP